MLGLLSLLDYPLPHCCGVDQSHWEPWLQSHFDCPKASVSPTLPFKFMLLHYIIHNPNMQPVNCLFLHLFGAKDGYHQSAIAELLRTCFISLPLLHFIFLSFSADAPLRSGLTAHFSQVQCLLNTGDVSHTQLWVTHRHQHFPVLHIRSAMVEDADDLMPIFQQCSATDVHQQYGMCTIYGICCNCGNSKVM